MERPTDSDMKPKRDQEKDVELDKKIEALRRKNEALMKRYKEVEEDRKKAEDEGMSLQSKKGKADDLTITISKSTSDSRVVVTKPPSSGSPSEKGQEDPGPDSGGGSPVQGAGRGHRKQLMVTMAGKKGKRVVREKPEKKPGSADVKSPTDDGQTRHVESNGRGKQLPHMTKRDTAAQEEIKSEWKNPEGHHKTSDQFQEPENQLANTDLNVPTSREEQKEYMRWKREREEIDKERVARHKNAKGQWRRAWDMDKSDNMFLDKSLADRDWGPSSRGGRNARRGQQKQGSDSRGHDKRGKNKAAKNVPVMSSKAKGKDRLTGRARRWQPNEEGENPETSDATLEEFLEELDALNTEGEEPKDQDSKTKPSSGTDSLSALEEVNGSANSLSEPTPVQEKAEASSLRNSEKRVRFSEELIQSPLAKQNFQDAASSDSRGSLNASAAKKSKQRPQQPLDSAKRDDGSCQVKGRGPSPPPLSQQQSSQTEHAQKESDPSTAPSSTPADKAGVSVHETSVQPVEPTKSNDISNTNAEEILGSSLSVLGKESGENHPTHSTSSDKAREHGKIV
ncbi:coiled-coil domain-containing protein 9B [Cololabis saira]|uniref:coiled-coil domain-containing protein 9B n=1 Tax=Cololabis saira TaxID=129043 RepID=UPI002AD20AAB|nr:coiled-coil domain-containing protein 9B [Cololabis saira]